MISRTSFQIVSFVLVVVVSTFGSLTANAQDSAEKRSNTATNDGPKGELYTNPATGIVYRKVVRTVENPVYETKFEAKQQQVFRPETVTENVPESKTVFVPQTEYTWQPVLHNRWNPFVKPTLTYRHVPQTQWKQQSDVVTRTQTRTKWIAENRTVNVPTRVVKMKREQKIEFEPVGRVAPPQATPPSSIDEAIAARMRPINPRTTNVQPITAPITTALARGTVQPPPFIDLTAIARGPVAPQASAFVARPTTAAANAANNIAQNRSQSRTYNLQNNNSNAIAARNSAIAPPGTVYGRAFGNTPYGAARSQDVSSSNRIAASTVGRLTSDPPRRSTSQGGLRTTDLHPGGGYGQALPPAVQPSGIANGPGWSLWR